MSIAEDVKKKGHFGTLAGKVNWCSHYLKQHKGSSKIKNINTISFSNSIPGYLSEENKNTNLKIYMYHNIHRSIISNNQDMEAISLHPYECLENMCYIYIYIHTHTHRQ